MKLEDIKPPKGFVIRGYEKPEPGDYILCPDNTFDYYIADPAGRGHYHYFCIILDRVWRPEVGKYYEFSAFHDFSDTVICKYARMNPNSCALLYEDHTGAMWSYIRPVEGELGK